MDTIARIAGMQIESHILEKERNLTRCVELIRATADQGTNLIVFPEAMLTGYVYESLDEALPFMETIPGPSTDRIMDCCRQSNIHVIIGLLEKDKEKYYNAAAFIGPSGLIGKYRKLHLPFLGIDRFLNHGDLPLKVYDSDVGRIGIGICYDSAFPEYPRSLTLLGADIIVIITNWTEGLDFVPEKEIPTRARENHVYFITVDRVGEERGVKFLGRSGIYDCSGHMLVEGKPYEEDRLYANINPRLAREKLQVLAPGKFEMDIIKDRRPEFYTILTQPLDDDSRIR